MILATHTMMGAPIIASRSALKEGQEFMMMTMISDKYVNPNPTPF